MSWNKDLSGAVTTTGGGTVTAFGALAAKSVLANATNGSAVPAALAGSAAFQHLRVNSANNALEWSILTAGDFPSNAVPLTGLATQATDTFVGNITAGTATPIAVGLATIASTSITWDSASHTFRLGAASGGDITRAANSLTYTINNDAVTYAKMQNVSATSRFLGRITAGAGDTEELTGTQATTLLDNFTSTLKGLAPLSGGGSTNFLRADGTWAAPPGTATTAHIIKDQTVSLTQRAGLNFIASTEIDPVITDDSVGNNTQVVFNLVNNTIPLARVVDGAATSVIGRSANSTGAHADIAASSDDTFLQRTSGALSFGGLGNAMVAQGVIGLDKLVGGEDENTATGAISDLARTLDRTNVLMFSGTAPVLNSVVSTNYPRGVPLIIQRQGTGFLDIVDNGTGTATNVFATYGNQTIRLADDEAAAFTAVDLTAGATDAKRWVCISHRFPFHNTPSLVADTFIKHDGTDWNTATPTQVVTALAGVNAFWTGTWEASGKFITRSGTAFSTVATANLAAQQNDFAAGNATACRFTSTGAQNLTGIVPPSTTEGWLMIVVNADTTDNLTLVHESASSSANNRFSLPGTTNRVLTPGGMAMLWYDVSSTRWRISFPI